MGGGSDRFGHNSKKSSCVCEGDRCLSNPSILLNPRKSICGPNCHKNASTLWEREGDSSTVAASFPFACRTKMSQQAIPGTERNLFVNGRTLRKDEDKEVLNNKDKQYKEAQYVGIKKPSRRYIRIAKPILVTQRETRNTIIPTFRSKDIK